MAPLLLPLLLGGCLDRTETITIRPDGSVRVEHVVQGDAGDLQNGAARYPDETHFAVTRRTERNEKGETRTVVEATADFGSVAQIPTRFGAPGDPFGDRALHMANELTVRREAGATYYRFVRTYRPRRWADYDHAWRTSVPGKIRDKLDDGVDLDDLSDDERRELILGAVAFERRKQQLWAWEALATVVPGHPRLVDVQLATRSAIADYFQEHLTLETVRKILDEPDAIDAATERVYGELETLVVDLARAELQADPERLRHELAANRHDFDVSDDLEDEKFTVRLKLPGTLVEHNGDQREGDDVIWKFDGEALRDRTHTLVATSVLRE